MAGLVAMMVGSTIDTHSQKHCAHHQSASEAHDQKN